MANKPTDQKIHTAPKFTDFVDDSTIHGIKDAVDSPEIGSKVVWTVLLSCSIAAMALGIYQTVRGYLERPKATEMKHLLHETYPYPPLVFCPPQSWVNASRVRELNMSNDEFAYALSFMPMIRVDYRIRDRNETARRFDRFMREHGFDDDIFEFYKSIAFESHELINCRTCDKWPAEKKMTEKGVCYKLDFKDLRTYHVEDTLRAPYFQFQPPKMDNSPSLPSYTSYSPVDRLYIGMHENDFFQANGLRLKPNRSYLVKIVPSQQMRLEHKVRTCMTTSEYYQRNISVEMCYSDCDQRTYGPTCWGFVHVGYFHGPRVRDPITNTTVPLWSAAFHDRIDPSTWTECEEIQREKYENCISRCLPRCDEWLFKDTVMEVNTRSLLPYAKQAAVTVVFAYYVRTGTFLMQEKATYTWDTFLSNVGGQMGLWLGMSILSILQLVFFIFRWIEFRLQTRAEEAIHHSHHHCHHTHDQQQQ